MQIVPPEDIKPTSNRQKWRLYLAAGYSVIFAATFFWGVAPTGYLVWSSCFGVVAFGLVVVSLRFGWHLAVSWLPLRQDPLDLAFVILFVFVFPTAAERYGVASWGAMFFQGVFLSYLVILSLFFWGAPLARRFSQPPPPDA